jgi:hypothetical protein
MELQGEAYLFNLSLIAITFAAVSALVMLIRQSLGGSLSKFDIHLITTYISYGFVISVIALLPSLVSFYNFGPHVLWAISSCLAVLFFCPVVATVIIRRRKASSHPAPFAVKVSFFVHGIANAILLVNAVVVPWQGVHLYATALTLSITIVMWMFARRIASLFSDMPLEGFDPNRA